MASQKMNHHGRPMDAVTPEKAAHLKPRRAVLDHPRWVPGPASRFAEGVLAVVNAQDVEGSEDVQESVRVILQTWSTLPEHVRAQLKGLLNTFYRTDSELGGENDPFKPLNGYTAIHPEPLPLAPENVFVFRGHTEGGKKGPQTLGWRNVFQLPVQYDVELCDGLLRPESAVLATRMMPRNGLRRRFIVVDDKVNELYGDKMAAYFAHHDVETHVVVLRGEERHKRMEAVDAVLEQLCVFGLHRREPVVAIGGGVVLDVVGLAANLYRRGVPYIRVPTTLLALVDASVGVKNGVDYCSCACGPQKNRVGSFYAPAGAFLDKSFIATQDARNVVNGLGEIMKLALVRSVELFELLESEGPRLVAQRFQGRDGAADRVIELSVQIMLEELGPNLWEQRLERCVDYGHTFSKILEMGEGADLMHGEAVNVDGFFCVVIALRRGMIDLATHDRILAAMRRIGLPTCHMDVRPDVMARGLKDAVEHRDGQQRIPLLSGGIGSAVCVNDITESEVEAACADLWALHGGPLIPIPAVTATVTAAAVTAAVAAVMTVSAAGVGPMAGCEPAGDAVRCADTAAGGCIGTVAAGLCPCTGPCS